MQLPTEVVKILKKLEKEGFKAYIVGGCVRDLLMNKLPRDWDITTNAKPEEIQRLFPESVYKNSFGTVAIKTKSTDKSLSLIEATTFRTEEKYTDKRHPDKITFASKVEDDLSRRDFTINAIAMTSSGKIIDPYRGQKDIKNQLIRTVGKPRERFNEDALRLLRAVRLASSLRFKIDEDTLSAIKKFAGTLKMIAKERIRDELIKIIRLKNADEGIILLKNTKLLEQFIPELLEGVGVKQNLHHIYTVWEHNLRALKYAAEQNFSEEARLASLFHDIGKPRTKRGKGKYSTFFGHEIVGAKIAAKILSRLRFPKKKADKIIKLVRWHLFYYNVGEVTESSVRRLLRKVGPENIKELIQIREADRIGSGVPKAKPYKLRHLEFMVDKVSSDPISVKMLNINGNDLMERLNVKPGPKMGLVLNSILAKVIDNPALNKKDKLLSLAKQLNKKSEEELKKNLKKIEDKERKRIEKIKKKHYV